MQSELPLRGVLAVFFGITALTPSAAQTAAPAEAPRAVSPRDFDVELRRILEETRLSVDFHSVTLGEIVDYLRIELKSRRPQERLGFLVVSNDEVQQRTVTLKLDDVSVSDLLHFVAEQTGTTFRVERGVVVFRPIQGAGALETRRYRVAPNFVEGLGGLAEEETPAAISRDPFR